MPNDTAGRNGEKGLSVEQQEIYVSIWQKAVDTQMHFNEMSVKARQFGLTFVAGALGLGVVLMARGQEFAISVPYFGGFDIHAIVVLIAASAFAMHAVRLLDLNVYHRMLRGAVYFGEDFESKYMSQIFDLKKGMTQAISHFSRHDDAKVQGQAGDFSYDGKSTRTAEEKLKRFYNISVGTLVASAIVLFLLTAHFGRSPRPSVPPPAPDATNHLSSTAGSERGASGSSNVQ